MKYFLDSAIIEEIDYAYHAFGIDGVTTNPRHIMNSGKPFLKAIEDLAKWVKDNGLDGYERFPISVEINPHLTDPDEMVKMGKEIAAISKNFVIKVPCTVEGCIAAKRLEEAGVRTNVTLVFTPSQALQAARLGAKFVSPFIGWKVNAGEDGIEYVRKIVEIYRQGNYKTEIIAAAIRTGFQIAECAAMGVDIVTAGLDVYKQSLTDPWTDEGLKRFCDAWDHTKGN